MDFKIKSRKIIIIVFCIVIVSLTCVGFNQFFRNNEEYALNIVSMEMNNSEDGVNFTVTLKILNTGRHDINNAQLNYLFIKDNEIIDSEIQSINLETNLEGTYSAIFINVPFKPTSTYKAIVTIYLGNKYLDTKTITKQM